MAGEGGAPQDALPTVSEMEQGAERQTTAVEPQRAAALDGAAEAPAASEGDDVSALPPDHPLLRRAQEALHRQLAEQKLRLQEELRERKKALKVGRGGCWALAVPGALCGRRCLPHFMRKHSQPLLLSHPCVALCLPNPLQDAKQKREDVGVELYGFQQHLAKLQLALERAGDEHAAVAGQRVEADGTLAALRAEVAREEAATAEEQGRVEGLQGELDRLAETLLHIQRYNEGVAGELAAAKRQTYATEGAVQTAEKAKREQDCLSDSMQQQLRRLARQAELQATALEAQRADTRAAQVGRAGAGQTANLAVPVRSSAAGRPNWLQPYYQIILMCGRCQIACLTPCPGLPCVLHCSVFPPAGVPG